MEENKTVEEVVETPETKEEKTFTQEEVNELLGKEKSRLKKGMPSKEELEAYNEWKESQKDQETKYQEALSKSNEKDNEISELKKERLILKSGITDDDDIDYIKYKVSKMEGDFEDNLKEYLANNSRFEKKETKATGMQTKVSTVEKESGVSAILKAKHPELFK